MNQGSTNQSFMNMMGDTNSPQSTGNYGPSGIPTYIKENYKSSRSPVQVNESYGYSNNYSKGHPIKNEALDYVAMERPILKSETYSSSERPSQMMNPFESNGRSSVPKPSYNTPETPIKTETYGSCENPMMKNETYSSNDRLPIKSEAFWTNNSPSTHHPSDGYVYGAHHTYGSSLNQDYSLPMPQDYLRATNHMTDNSNEQSYQGQIAKIKDEMGMPSAEVQSPMSLPSQMYPQLSSPHNKLFEPSMSLQSHGYPSHEVAVNNPMYDIHSMSSQNHMYDQPSSSSQNHLYQSSMLSQGQAYHPMPMSLNSHLYQQTMSSGASNNPYQPYPMYSNSNPYNTAHSSSAYPSYIPQNPWTNYNTGFPPGADSYPDTVVSCSPKKKTKINHSNPTKKEPVQIVSQQHFHSKRGIYLFQIREMHVASASTFSISDNLLMIEKQLCENLIQIDLPDNVQYVYNPLEYAFNPHRNYTEKFCNTQKQILFLGMNPGPFGMSQNGVPFGEYNIVRDWLKITGEVSKPIKEHPKRLIVGLDCKRSEVTGSRFWGYFRRLCITPENFFKHCFVYNICPMAFMSDTGKNITPPQIPAHVLKAINTVCNTSLIEVIQLLNVKTVIGVGNYAYNSAQKLLSSANMEHIKVHVIMHPSPINPAANKGWDNIARDQLKNIGILELLQSGTESNCDYN